MDASRYCVNMCEIPVYVGAFQLAPLAVLLHQGKQPCERRSVLGAPFAKHLHGRVVRRFSVSLCSLQDGKSEILIEILLECRRGRVCSDLHVACHGIDLFLQRRDLFLRLCLFGKHRIFVHGNSVVPHHAAVYGGRRFDLLHNGTVPRQETIKPVVALVIQAERVVRVGAGVA